MAKKKQQPVTLSILKPRQVASPENLAFVPCCPAGIMRYLKYSYCYGPGLSISGIRHLAVVGFSISRISGLADIIKL